MCYIIYYSDKAKLNYKQSSYSTMICLICVCGKISKDLFYRLFPNERLQVWRGFEEKLLALLVCEETAELVLACSSDAGTGPRISNNGQGFSLHAYALDLSWDAVYVYFKQTAK